MMYVILQRHRFAFMDQLMDKENQLPKIILATHVPLATLIIKIWCFYFWKKNLPVTSFPTSMIVSSSKVMSSSSFMLFLFQAKDVSLLLFMFSWKTIKVMMHLLLMLPSNAFVLSCDVFLTCASQQSSCSKTMMLLLLLFVNGPIALKPWCSFFHVFQDVPLACAFINAPIAFDFCHAPSCSWLLCDVHAPLIGNPMAPSHDAPFVNASMPGWSLQTIGKGL